GRSQAKYAGRGCTQGAEVVCSDPSDGGAGLRTVSRVARGADAGGDVAGGGGAAGFGSAGGVSGRAGAGKGCGGETL
ncbi:MAG: hypothetical protein AVDCRST_MAG01-01-2585, partial [uncultured Rubrobacteraceae bacterium]